MNRLLSKYILFLILLWVGLCQLGYAQKGFIASDTIVAIVPRCGLEGEICIPDINATDAKNYRITIDAKGYLGSPTSCIFDTTKTYMVAPVIAVGAPFKVQSWKVGTKTYSFSFQTLAHLRDSMLRLDPLGTWQIDGTGNNIVGGLNGVSYSEMRITAKNSVVYTVNYAKSTTPKGVKFNLLVGRHTMIFTRMADNVSDTVYAFVACLMTTKVTKLLAIWQSEETCLDFSEMPFKPIATTIKQSSRPRKATFELTKNNTCIKYSGVALGQDTAMVLSCSKGNICDTTYFYVNVGLPRCKNTQKDTILAQLSNCIGLAQICIPDLSKTVADTLQIQIDGVAYTGERKTCGSQNIQQYLYSSFATANTIRLNSWSVDNKVFSGTFTTVKMLVDSMNIWDKTGAWTLNETLKVISGGSTNKTYSPLKINSLPDILFNTVSVNNGTLLNIKAGNSTIILKNAKGTCNDEVKTIVRCVQASSTSKIIEIGKNDLVCLDFAELSGVPISIENKRKGTGNAKFELLSNNGVNCVRFTGVSEGKDTAMYVACDKNNLCDTTRLFLTINKNSAIVQRVKIVTDTVFLNVTKRFCYPTGALNVPTNATLTVENICAQKSGEHVVFKPKPSETCGTGDKSGFVIEYQGKETGRDTACLVIKANNTILDTVRLYVRAMLPVKRNIVETVATNNVKTICIDTTRLGGRVTEIKDICAKNSGINATIVLNPTSKCLTIRGKTIGADTACIVLRDNLNVYDTTQLFIDVVRPIRLVADSIVTNKNKSVNIVVQANDSLFNQRVTQFNFLSGKPSDVPKHGITTIAASNNGLSYLPNMDYCGRDTFRYFVCTVGSCDTAMVSVRITCEESSEEIKTRYGISPNNDNKNDELELNMITIDQQFVIYNRWGNQIFIKESGKEYRAWNGKWQGQDIPDGTYFFVLNDRNGKLIKAGYIELLR